MVDATNRDGRRARGDRTRRAVLDRAAQAGSVHGLGSTSLADLASGASVTKSAVAGLFGAKESLQLATVEFARAVFVEHVVVPARSMPPGVARVWALCTRWVEYSRLRVFDGGCFFRVVAREFAARPGPVRDAVRGALADWEEYLRRSAVAALEAGELDVDTDADQLVYEISALYAYANDSSVMHGDDEVYDRALTGIRARLVAVGADPGVLG